MSEPIESLQETAIRLEHAGETVTGPAPSVQPSQGPIVAGTDSQPHFADNAPDAPVSRADRIAQLHAALDAERDAQEAEDADKPFVPNSAPGSGKGYYQVVEGDDLPAIAAKLGLSNPYQDLFLPNMATIDGAAREAGYPGGSDQGAILPVGTWLEVPLYTLIKPVELRL
jgi:hypothetical protein